MIRHFAPGVLSLAFSPFGTPERTKRRQHVTITAATTHEAKSGLLVQRAFTTRYQELRDTIQGLVRHAHACSTAWHELPHTTRSHDEKYRVLNVLCIFYRSAWLPNGFQFKANYLELVWESFCSSPPNVSLTKPPVLKPAPGRGPSPPRRHRSIVLCKQENTWKYVVFIESFIASSSEDVLGGFCEGLS